MKIYRSQNKNITEIFAGSFFGTKEIADMYALSNDVLFEIEIDENSSFSDVWDFSGDIDAGLNDEDNLQAVGKFDFLSYYWKKNGGYGETYLSTKNLVLSDIKEIGTHINEDEIEIVVYAAKATLKTVSLDEIKIYTSRDEYNKR